VIKKALLLIVVLALAATLVYVFIPRSPEDLTVLYPYDGAVFPPEIPSPKIHWDDTVSGAAEWSLQFEFPGGEVMSFESDEPSFRPGRDEWASMKDRTLNKEATVTVTGYRKIAGFTRAVSSKSFTFSTSSDEVGAPVFFRAVPLPFEFAVNNMEMIQWCLGDVASEETAPAILENMPVCGNCHSFTDDGATLGMDVDYANDKGSYMVASISEEIDLTNDKVITWSDYERDDGELTFGLLTQLSPDGRYAVSTVKDRSVFVPVNDLYYSQLFFPLKGILVYYDMLKKSYHALPGASDKDYVQSNPEWNPDGTDIVFARSKAGVIDGDTGKVLLTPEQCEKYITRKELFKFDLYRVPFNDGKGGEAVPIEGASGNGVSNYFPKYSPDGKWIVFCRSESFMLLQPDSRLFIMPAEGGEVREMNCNTNNMNSWHSWSPNGKWMVFSSKAYTPYTQLFLTHIDENGNDSPPVLLENFTPEDRAANIPEFVNIPLGGINKMNEKFIDYYSFYNKAGQMVDEGRLDEAEVFFRSSIELKPDFAMSHKRLGYLLTRMNRRAETEKEWQLALDLDSSDHLLHLNYGTLLMEKGEVAKAEKEYRTTIKLEKTCAPAFVGLGIICLSRDDKDGALSQFKKSVIADPGFDDGYFRIGTLYMDRGDMKNAEEAFRKASEINDRNFGAVFGLARSLSRDDEKTDDAIAAYNRAISLNPSEVQAYVELGNLYIKNDDIALAIETFERALQVDPSKDYIRNFLSQLKQRR